MDHFHIYHRTVSRSAQRIDTNAKHTWERFLSKHVMYPRTITYFEFQISILSSHSRNLYKVSVGASPRVDWKYDESNYHQNLIGLQNGFSLAASGDNMMNGMYLKSEESIHEGSRVGFSLDNGYTHPNKVIVHLFINSIDRGEIENDLKPLQVTEYKAGICLCPGHQVEITKIKTLKSRDV
jgi:hypothetical protein